MNLLKRFMRNDNADAENEEYYDDVYQMPDDVKNEYARREPDGEGARAYRDEETEKVSLKLIKPKSHTEATEIADKLKSGCIVLLDVGLLTKEQARRLVDFLAGVAYVLGGGMIKTNKNTIVVSPSGVDISGFAPDADNAPDEAEAGEDEA